MDENQVQEKIEQILEHFDSNKDGVLNKEEFRQIYDATKDELARIPDLDIEDYDAVFAFFDKNGNGEIEKNELGAVIKQFATGEWNMSKQAEAAQFWHHSTLARCPLAWHTSSWKAPRPVQLQPQHMRDT